MTEKSEIIIYQTEDGQTRIQTIMQDQSVWLSQAQMAELFQKTVPTINEHIKNIYDEGELEQGATIRNFRIVQTEGKREVSRDVNLYNLDVIITTPIMKRYARPLMGVLWFWTLPISNSFARRI